MTFLVSADSGCITVILLDLTAAFDTVSHHILISQLSAIGITGTAMFWFISYLSHRLIFLLVFKTLNRPLVHSLKVSLKTRFLDLSCSTFICFPLVKLSIATVSAIIVMLMTCKFTYQVAPPLLFHLIH